MPVGVSLLFFVTKYHYRRKPLYANIKEEEDE
jgi:hypothetical protein